MNCLLVLSLAVFGASAAPCLSNCNTGCSYALPGPSTHVQTGIVENTPSFVPSYIPPTSVSQSCHCLKTIIRPQIRNEVITVPTVDRLVRTVTSPIVDAISVNCGGNTRNVDIPTCSTGNTFSGVVSGAYPGVVGGAFQGVSADAFQGVVGGNAFPGFVGGSCSGIVGSAFPVVSGAYQGVVGGSFPVVGSSGCGCGSNFV